METKFSDWRGCYDSSWRGTIVNQAFSHPAKFSKGLIERIVDHGLEQGYWKPGDLIGDPFGGVALGGIACGARGINWAGVELEPRFVELADQNLRKHGPLFMESGATSVTIRQGDSRQFAELVGEVAGCVTSPPYAANEKSDRTGQARDDRRGFRQGRGGFKTSECYGDTDGQIGRLKSGNLDAVISSPPYAERIVDPPSESAKRARAESGRDPNSASWSQDGYGTTEGQIGALKSGDVDGVITSPPWEKNTEGSLGAHKFKNPEDALQAGRGNGASDAARLRQLERDVGKSYGDSDGQIGNNSGETYWHAMRDVYSQMLLAMKPGAVAAIVVKDYVKNKARAPLCDQTCQLLESLGFTVFERTRCHLVKETRHPDLFGGEDHVEKKERKSFFRRLAEKNGSPRIDWEEVLWCRR